MAVWKAAIYGRGTSEPSLVPSLPWPSRAVSAMDEPSFAVLDCSVDQIGRAASGKHARILHVGAAAAFRSLGYQILINGCAGMQRQLSPAADKPSYAPWAVVCHFRTHAPQQRRGWAKDLLDHLVGQRKQLVGDFEAERLGGLEVDDQLVFGRLLHR
jgi:hypothetical protein